MTPYRCPVCGNRDPNLYQICSHPACPDGRDQMTPRKIEPPPPRIKSSWGWHVLLIVLAIGVIVLITLDIMHANLR